jgi:hypothetical protein
MQLGGLVFVMKKICLMVFLLSFLHLEAGSPSVSPEDVEFDSEAFRLVSISMQEFYQHSLESTTVNISDCEVVRKFLRPKKSEWCRVSRSGICRASKLAAISCRLAEDIDDKGELMEELRGIQDLCRKGLVSKLELDFGLKEFDLKNKNQLKRRVSQCEKQIKHYEEIKNSIDLLISASFVGVLTAEGAWNYFSHNLPDYFSRMSLRALRICFVGHIMSNYGLE